MKRKFLDLIAAGHDPEAAAVGAGLPLSATKRVALQGQIQDALRIGTARLRSRLTSLALGAGDARTLENVLTHRMAQIDETEISSISRVIVHQGKCEHCGYPLVEPASGVHRKRTRLSDPPAIPMDDTAPPESPSVPGSTEHAPTHPIHSRRTAAMMELVQGGNTVVEIPRT